MDLDGLVSAIDAASGMTHGHPISKMGCMIFTVLLKELLSSRTVASAWESARRIQYSHYYSGECLKAYSTLLSDGFAEIDESLIGETGYVVDTLMTAVYSLLNSDSYEGAILTAVGMGYDTDTSAAVTGALAGAFYGIDSIPKRWLSKLRKRESLVQLAKRFADSLGD